MVGVATKVSYFNFLLSVSKYSALPLLVLPLRTVSITQWQPTGRAEEVPGHHLEAGEAEGGSVVVGSNSNSFLSEITRSQVFTQTV